MIVRISAASGTTSMWHLRQTITRSPLHHSVTNQVAEGGKIILLSERVKEWILQHPSPPAVAHFSPLSYLMLFQAIKINANKCIMSLMNTELIIGFRSCWEGRADWRWSGNQCWTSLNSSGEFWNPDHEARAHCCPLSASSSFVGGSAQHAAWPT